MCSLYQSQEVSCWQLELTDTFSATCYALQEGKKTQQALQSSSRLAFPGSTANLIHGIKTETVNFAWINHSLLSHFIFALCLILPFFFLPISSRSLRRGRCCKLCEKAPDLLGPPQPWHRDEQPDSGGGSARQHLLTAIISTKMRTCSVYIVISAMNLYLAHTQ